MYSRKLKKNKKNTKLHAVYLFVNILSTFVTSSKS